MAGIEHAGRLIKTIFRIRFAKEQAERTRHLAQLYAVLRPFGSGQAGRDIIKIELDDLRVSISPA